MSAPDDRRAAGRFWLLQAIRLAMLGMVLAGAMAIAGTLDLNRAQGAVLLVGGTIGFFFLPALLARHWRDER